MKQKQPDNKPDKIPRFDQIIINANERWPVLVPNKKQK